MSQIILFLREYLTISLVYFIGFAVLIDVLWRRRHIYYISWKLDGPWALPLVGNLLDFTFDGEIIFREFIALREKYGSVFRLWGGPKLIVFVSNPDDIQVVTQHKHSQDKPYIYKFTEDWLGDGILTTTGSHWHGRRKIMSQAFSVQMLDSYLPVFNANSRIFAEEVKIHANTNQYFELFDYTTRFTLDTVCEIAFGIKLESQTRNAETGLYDNDYAHATETALEIIFKRIVSPLLHLDFFFKNSKYGKEFTKCVNVFNRICDAAIAREHNTYNTSKTNNNTLNLKAKSMVAMLVHNNEKYQLTDKDMRDELNTMIAGGADTSSHSLAYALMLLAMFPDIQDKVCSEIKQFAGDEDETITKEILNDMPYLEQVIKEILRLYPLFSSIVREVKGDIQLKTRDVTLTEGTIVMISAYGVQHDKGIWGEDAEEFNPDRFSPENSKNRHPYSFMAFSAGSRKCMGHKFAKTNMKVMIIHFLKKYRVVTEQPFSDVRCEFNILTKNVGGWKIKLEHR